MRDRLWLVDCRRDLLWDTLGEAVMRALAETHRRECGCGASGELCRRAEYDLIVRALARGRLFDGGIGLP